MISARLQRLTLSALLAAAVLAVYAPVAHYDFIALDDARYVKDNENINHGFSWSGVKWSFENIVAGNWHPVTMLSHMADCQIYGLSPGGQHFTNVLLHMANTVLLFWVLLALTERRKFDAAAKPATLRKPEHPSKQAKIQPPVSPVWPCALVAALFALHPLHVESVAWIAERKDVLSGFFGLLTLWCYRQYVVDSESGRKASWVFYVLSLVMFSLGLMSKSMLVTLPFVMLLLDFWPLQRFNVLTFQRLCLEKAPFLALAAIFSVITYLVQKSASAVVALRDFPMQARLGNVMVSYAHYLEKTFWPDSLAMLYPYQHWTTGQIAGSTVLVVGVSLAAIWAARRKPYIFVGWFWFLGMLVPVIGLVQVGLQAMADHYTYLPLIGIFIVLAWGLTDIAVDVPMPRPLAICGVVVVIACLGFASAVQVRYWKDSETLFDHSARVTGHNTVAHYILGALYDSQGKTDLAATEFTDSIADDPGNVKALCGLGYILCNQGKLDEAAAEYQAALRVDPDLAKAHFGLAEALMKEHNFDAAMSEYSLALQSDPDIPEAHYQLAGLYSAKGNPASAISQLEEAVRLAPDWPPALNNLAWMRATESDSTLRDGAEAAQLAIRAAGLTGKNNPSMLDTLAAAYAETGQFTDAVQTATTAVQYANAADETNLANEIELRLKLYQSGQPYRE
ncbi:MAG TPA: tetratricopeptide repeat protein [Candidatus Sulfotelmatobacter sp.]|nr:tetratricopeptide repeat protein [Candidatus Sulfotelmatobacter sp.]